MICWRSQIISYSLGVPCLPCGYCRLDIRRGKPPKRSLSSSLYLRCCIENVVSPNFLQKTRNSSRICKSSNTLNVPVEIAYSAEFRLVLGFATTKENVWFVRRFIGIEFAYIGDLDIVISLWCNLPLMDRVRTFVSFSTPYSDPLVFIIHAQPSRVHSPSVGLPRHTEYYGAVQASDAIGKAEV